MKKEAVKAQKKLQKDQRKKKQEEERLTQNLEEGQDGAL